MNILQIIKENIEHIAVQEADTVRKQNYIVQRYNMRLFNYKIYE